MASRKDIEAGAAYIRLYLKKNQLLTGLASGIKEVSRFAARATKSIVGIGASAFTIGAVLVKKFAKSVKDMDEVAKRTGVSTEALTEFSKAWEIATKSAQDLGYVMASSLAPGMTNIADMFTRIVKGTTDWIKANQDLFDIFTALTNEFVNGDWVNLGLFQIESLRLGMLDGLNAISKALGEGFGDIFGHISAALMGLDFEEVWDTTLSALATTWDQFILGLTSSFVDAANSIIEVWRKVTSFISDQIIANQKTLKSLIDAVADFTIPGGSRGRVSTGLLGPDIQPGDVGQAQQIARGEIGSAAGSMTSALERRRDAARAQAHASADEFANRVMQGRKEIEDSARSSRMEAERLMAAMLRNVEDRTHDLGGTAGKSFGTFSAAAALAAGGAAGMEDRMVKANEDTKKAAETLVDINTKLLLAMNGISIGLRHPG